MEAIVITLIIIALIAYGLERNRRRQDHPRPRLAGSSDVIDRDRERFSFEFLAAIDRPNH